jgi:hypothetical protein
MEEGNDSALKFSSSSAVDGGRAECLPDDVPEPNQIRSAKADRKHHPQGIHPSTQECISNKPTIGMSN